MNSFWHDFYLDHHSWFRFLFMTSFPVISVFSPAHHPLFIHFLISHLTVKTLSLFTLLQVQTPLVAQVPLPGRSLGLLSCRYPPPLFPIPVGASPRRPLFRPCPSGAAQSSRSLRAQLLTRTLILTLASTSFLWTPPPSHRAAFCSIHRQVGTS